MRFVTLNLLLAILVAAVAAGARAQQTRPEAQSLMPFETGARWFLRDQAGAEVQLLCCRRVRAPGGDWFAMMYVDKTSRLEFWRERGGAIERTAGRLEAGRVLEDQRARPEVLLDSALRWEWKEPRLELSEPAVTNVGRRAKARLHVPAGELDCVCGSITVLRDREVVRTTTYAFAPGVGPVAIISHEPQDASTRSLELVRHERGIASAEEPLAALVGDQVDAEHAGAARRPSRDWLTLDVMREPELLAFGEQRFVRLTMLDGEMRHYWCDGKTVQRIAPNGGEFWSGLARSVRDPLKVAEAYVMVTASVRQVLGPRLVVGATAVRQEGDQAIASASAFGTTKNGTAVRCQIGLTITRDRVLENSVQLR